jgi:hypothetical protein
MLYYNCQGEIEAGAVRGAQLNNSETESKKNKKPLDNIFKREK